MGRCAVIFNHAAQMRFSDTDAMGHVNHGRFLTYLEDARVALFAATGDANLAAVGVILARAEVDYRRPLMLSAQPVNVSVWVAEIGTKSFTLDYELEHEGEIAAQARTVIVGFDYAAQRSRVLTDLERAALERWRKG